ncbi:hypothetical protein E5288_WYG002089 [Bos mutus]|uniref:Uncharacterized protein n=1 Tax=Bos mutus TaxID=72004 RepID=A0A6B0R9Y5_9CETA|nr:hypothetical protein [Bos mutus]
MQNVLLEKYARKVKRIMRNIESLLLDKNKVKLRIMTVDKISKNFCFTCDLRSGCYNGHDAIRQTTLKCNGF